MLVRLAPPDRYSQLDGDGRSDELRGYDPALDIYDTHTIKREANPPKTTVFRRQELRFAEHEGQPQTKRDSFSSQG
jgi:hypothetical protein